MTDQPIHKLTSADIADLRVWRAKGGLTGEDGFERVPFPFLVCSASDGALYLHAGGRTVAGGLRAEVMCALLYMEKLEPGFCEAVSSSALTVEEALRTPLERREAIRRQAAERAAYSASLSASAAASARRVRQLRTSTPAEILSTSLDDLLDTL